MEIGFFFFFFSAITQLLITISKQKMASQLAPLPQPIGVFDQFITPHGDTLVVKEKLLDSFDIKNVNGQPIIRVQGQLLSLHGRKTVSDMSGNHLFDVVKELLHIHATFVAEDKSQKKLLEVKSKFARKLLFNMP